MTSDSAKPHDEPERQSEREKLVSLREAIRSGQDSGPAEPWDPEEIKRDGRVRRAAANEAAVERVK